MTGIFESLSAIIRQSLGSKRPGANFLARKQAFLDNGPAVFFFSAAIYAVGALLIFLCFSGCVTSSRARWESTKAYDAGKADGMKIMEGVLKSAVSDCEAQQDSMRREIAEKNDRLRRFNQIYRDGRLRELHTNPQGK